MIVNLSVHTKSGQGVQTFSTGALNYVQWSNSNGITLRFGEFDLNVYNLSATTADLLVRIANMDDDERQNVLNFINNGEDYEPSETAQGLTPISEGYAEQ